MSEISAFKKLTEKLARQTFFNKFGNCSYQELKEKEKHVGWIARMFVVRKIIPDGKGKQIAATGRAKTKEEARNLAAEQILAIISEEEHMVNRFPSKSRMKTDKRLRNHLLKQRREKQQRYQPNLNIPKKEEKKPCDSKKYLVAQIKK